MVEDKLAADKVNPKMISSYEIIKNHFLVQAQNETITGRRGESIRKDYASSIIYN